MQTVTVREAETQLQSLVKQVETTQQPVILTNDTARPVAVLTFLAQEKPDQNAVVARRLEILTSVIQMWQQHYMDPTVDQEAAQLFQSQLRQLGTTAGEQTPIFGALLMLLRLAARQVITPTPQRQVQALAIGVTALENQKLSWLDIESVDQQLLDSGLDVRADFGNEDLLNDYVDVS